MSKHLSDEELMLRAEKLIAAGVLETYSPGQPWVTIATAKLPMSYRLIDAWTHSWSMFDSHRAKQALMLREELR